MLKLEFVCANTKRDRFFNSTGFAKYIRIINTASSKPKITILAWHIGLKKNTRYEILFLVQF